MEAKELRVGNIVFQDYIQGYTYVAGLFGGISDEVWYSDNEELDNPARGPIQSFLPIPLTPEWLERFGLKNRRIYEAVYAWEIPGHFQIQEHKGEYYLGLGYDGNTKRLEYVHEIQNLYFALTGNELTPKQ